MMEGEAGDVQEEEERGIKEGVGEESDFWCSL